MSLYKERILTAIAKILNIQEASMAAPGPIKDAGKRSRNKRHVEAQLPKWKMLHIPHKHNSETW